MPTIHLCVYAKTLGVNIVAPLALIAHNQSSNKPYLLYPQRILQA